MLAGFLFEFYMYSVFIYSANNNNLANKILFRFHFQFIYIKKTIKDEWPFDECNDDDDDDDDENDWYSKIDEIKMFTDKIHGKWMMGLIKPRTVFQLQLNCNLFVCAIFKRFSISSKHYVQICIPNKTA